MNLDHLRATLWLRWRILRNRVRRGGKVGNTLLAILIALGALACVGLFFVGWGIAMDLMPEVSSRVLMFAWGGMSLGFLFFWTIGLVTDLQRSDAMSFKNLLHLPVSLSWVFLYNYLSSFVSLSVAFWLPPMLGFGLGMVLVTGPRMLLCLPLIAGFFLMVTALTYQLRGWLARLMENKRRGRNIVAALTFVFIALVQVPNLINIGTRGSSREERREFRALQHTAAEEGEAGGPATEELARRVVQEAEQDRAVDRTATLVAQVVPVGWLPYGVRASFDGRLLPAGLCALGMAAIGVLSLRRSYRKTMASVVGGADAGRSAAALPRAESPAEPRTRSGGESRDEAGRRTKPPLVERSLPFVSDRASAVAFATLRGLLRAPETKLLLLSPVILLVIFGMLFRNEGSREALGAFAPAMGLGAITLGLLSIMQLIQNQFGLDRAGFRAFVLSPVPRAELLVGKNLATAPLGIGIGLIALVGLQFLLPADASHFAGSILQLVSAYLLLCLVGNLLSILNPMRLKEGSFKAQNVKFMTVVLQLFSMLLIPLTLAPLGLPSLVDFFLGHRDWARFVPLYPMLHAATLACVLVLYRVVVRRQGELLQDREQTILEVLTRD